MSTQPDRLVCSVCGKYIKGYSRYINGKPVHTYCVSHDDCNACGKPIYGRDCHHFKGAWWHSGCVKKEPCKGCGRFVFNDKGIRSNGEIWHYQCIQCKQCGVKYVETKGEFTFNNRGGDGILHIGRVGARIHTECVLDKQKCPCGMVRYALDRFWPTILIDVEGAGSKRTVLAPWSPIEHKRFPFEFRSAVLTMLLMHKRLGTVFTRLPRDVLFIIIRQIARPSVWKFWNGFDTSIRCTTYRCTQKGTCSKCTGNVRLIASDDELCKVDMCTLYRGVCDECHSKIPHDAKLEEVCTGYRCIYETCIKCNRIIRYAQDKQEELCLKDQCNLYSMDDCPCGNLIPIQPKDPMMECTKYRCVRSACMKCKGPIRPFEYDDLDLCSKTTCNVYKMADCKCKRMIRIRPAEPLLECTPYRCIDDRCNTCGSDIRPYEEMFEHDLCSLKTCIIKSKKTDLCIQQICNIVGIDKAKTIGKRTLAQQIEFLKAKIVEKMDDISETDATKLSLLLASL
jgi:hypothetical protein